MDAVGKTVTGCDAADGLAQGGAAVFERVGLEHEVVVRGGALGEGGDHLRDEIGHA